MKVFVSNILSNNLLEAKKDLNEIIETLFYEKLEQMKKEVAEEMFGEVGVEVILDTLDEGNKMSNVQKMGRTKLIKVRIRKGKIQRRKKFSSVKGYTIRSGKLTRMMPAELRHRKVASKRSKFKRSSKLKLTLRKRKISLRKRRAMGL
jgi:hypothetical protein